MVFVPYKVNPEAYAANFQPACLGGNLKVLKQGIMFSFLNFAYIMVLFLTKLTPQPAW
jgi:hypothetical protein